MAAIVILIAITAACKATTVSTRYSPLHPPNNAPVSFSVKAKDGDGIALVELFVYEYELSLVNGMKTMSQRPGGQWGRARTWSYPSTPNQVDETWTSPGYPASTMVKFVARVTDGLGKKKTEEWAFAAGDWPFGDDPIPIWGNGAPADRIDVAFVADRDDYNTARDMLGALETLIFDGYHVNNGVKRGKKYWQFYYSPERGTISDYDAGPPYTMDIPSGVTASAIIDHAAIIHTTLKRDWASGGNFGTEPTNIGTACHESAHAAFDLSDEYAGGGQSASGDPHHNVHATRGSAQSYNSANGWPASDVQAIGNTGWWRVEPSNLGCIMFDDGDAAMPDFERTCINRIVWFYSQLGP